MTRTYRLASNGPIDLEASCRPFTENRADRAAFSGGALYRAARIGAVALILKARALAEDEIEVQVEPAEGDQLPPDKVIVAGLRRKFSLDLDLPAFYGFLETVPELRGMAADHRGLRPLRKDSLLEALVLAIADQQVNVAFAAELKERLLTRYGHRYDVAGHALWLFPRAEVLAALEEHALRPLQYTRNKSSYITGLARKFLQQPEWERLAGRDAEIVERLIQLRGIGRWTAEYGAMLGLGVTDTLPAADIALLRMVQSAYGLPQRPTEQELRQIGEGWSPWRGMVTFYLWRQEEFIAETDAII